MRGPHVVEKYVMYAHSRAWSRLVTIGTFDSFEDAERRLRTKPHCREVAIGKFDYDPPGYAERFQYRIVDLADPSSL